MMSTFIFILSVMSLTGMISIMLCTESLKDQKIFAGIILCATTVKIYVTGLITGIRRRGIEHIKQRDRLFT